MSTVSAALETVKHNMRTTEPMEKKQTASRNHRKACITTSK